MIDIEAFVAELRTRGHTVEWGFDGPVSSNKPPDPGWWCKVDGGVVATGAALGLLEEALGEWLRREHAPEIGLEE